MLYSLPLRFGFKKRGDCTTLYVLNLALIDLLFCVVCSLQLAAQATGGVRGWALGRPACVAVFLVRWALGWLDFLALALIAFSRQVSVDFFCFYVFYVLFLPH